MQGTYTGVIYMLSVHSSSRGYINRGEIINGHFQPMFWEDV